jgi:hypothetical protein
MSKRERQDTNGVFHCFRALRRKKEEGTVNPAAKAVFPDKLSTYSSSDK